MNKFPYMLKNDIWKDKRIPKEAKYIYGYIYSKGIDKYIVDINVGELQPLIKIKNKGLKNNLNILEKLEYLIYEEYDNGMYTIRLV